MSDWEQRPAIYPSDWLEQETEVDEDTVKRLQEENERLKIELARASAKFAGPAEGRFIHPFVRLMYDEMCKQGVTQRGLAKRAGVDDGALRRWMRGDVSPSLITFEAVINALGHELKVVKSER